MVSKILASKKGASSILVILLLVVLMVFGIAALTVSLANMRLGQKVSDWNGAYYAVEGAAWERFAKIDKAIKAACEESNFDNALKENLDGLEFEAIISSDQDLIYITYETWDQAGNIGHSATLALEPKDRHSLRAIEWKETQQQRVGNQ